MWGKGKTDVCHKAFVDVRKHLARAFSSYHVCYRMELGSLVLTANAFAQYFPSEPCVYYPQMDFLEIKAQFHDI